MLPDCLNLTQRGLAAHVFCLLSWDHFSLLIQLTLNKQLTEATVGPRMFDNRRVMKSRLDESVPQMCTVI